MELTKEQISAINNKCPYNQGVFVEPYGIPTSIKEPVIYCRYDVGGYRGGSCWGDRAESYYNEAPKDKMKVLEIVLTELCPNISYLQYKQIESLIDYNDYSEDQYYGNSTDWKIEFIKLSDLYNLLETFNS